MILGESVDARSLRFKHMHKEGKIKFAYLPTKLNDGRYIWLAKYLQKWPCTVWGYEPNLRYQRSMDSGRLGNKYAVINQLIEK